MPIQSRDCEILGNRESFDFEAVHFSLIGILRIVTLFISLYYKEW